MLKVKELRQFKSQRQEENLVSPIILSEFHSILWLFIFQWEGRPAAKEKAQKKGQSDMINYILSDNPRWLFAPMFVRMKKRRGTLSVRQGFENVKDNKNIHQKTGNFNRGCNETNPTCVAKQIINFPVHRTYTIVRETESKAYLRARTLYKHVIYVYSYILPAKWVPLGEQSLIACSTHFPSFLLPSACVINHPTRRRARWNRLA